MNTTNGRIYGVATPDVDQLKINSDATISVPLSLHYANILEDGSIQAGAESDSLLSMTADTTYYMTAIVYVNGDLLSNASVSATQGVSLAGTVNIQFASSARLTAMNYHFE
jgi:hypothetical protein